MIRVCDDLESLSQAAADLFTAAAQWAVTEQGRFSVALSGGSTPRRCYELLAQPPFRDRIPWSKVHVFWGDERCVPANDPRSNARMAREALLDHVPLSAGQIHPISCVADPNAAALNYQQMLTEFFAAGSPRFDLVFLGLGDDGHTASLFPGTAALQETERWVTAVRKPGEDISRLTLTAPLLNRAGLVVFLVAGAGKTNILHQVLQGSTREKRFPAQLIAPQNGELIWLVDRAAGSGVKSLERQGEQ